MARYIDADKALEILDKWLEATGALPKGSSYYHECKSCINDTPTEEVQELKHGEWVKPYINKYGHPCHCCSICGFKASQQDKNYCPGCGAQMECKLYTMIYFPFPIDCERCPKAISAEQCCEEMELLYDGKHPKYTKTQDWELMCEICPQEVTSREYREDTDKDSIGKTKWFTKEEAEQKLKEICKNT